jgi:hypothetical protein
MQASFSVRVVVQLEDVSLGGGRGLVGEIERRLVLQAAAVAGVSARLVTRDL